MYAAHRTRSERSFSLAVLASVLVVFALTTALLGGFVLWSSAEIDNVALDRQSQRVSHGLSSQLTTVPRDQESVVVWDDAVIAIRDRNLDWLDINVGSWMYTYYSHDESYIVLPDDSLAYASRGGVRTPFASFGERADVALRLVDEARSKARAGYADVPPHATDYVLIGGQPAIASAIPFVSDTGNITTRLGEEPILVSITMLDLAYELDLIDKYMMEVGRFTNMASLPGMASLPVTNRAGRIVTFFEWTPFRPGAQLLARTTPALGGAFVVIAAILAGLLFRLWRSSTALESKRLDAERLANEDSLTGLPNRLSFESQFDLLLHQPRQRERPIGLLMLDLDRFKQVNDTLGHHAGDELIQMVGERLRHLIQPGEVLARLGGDEFGILTRRPETEVQALGATIIKAISTPFRIHSSEAFVGVSIGVVMASSGERDRRELARKADIALYEAKSAGRNRTAAYKEAMNDLVQGRHTIEAELREALKRTDQLWVAFQPLFSRDGGHLSGAEALVRWSHPRLGQIPPSRFVAVAEGSGLIEALGEFVLRRACDMGARWPGNTIAVNISPAQLRNPHFPDLVFSTLAASGMRPEDLEIEITESILLDDENATATAIRTFRAAGIQVALDDFGTGYSSLNYLKRYPVDRIKIDRSFVSQLAATSASNAIVQAMVTLAHALGIQVTAEGVETSEQHRVLVAMGCNTFQGYLLSPPLTAQRMEQLFEAPAARMAEVA